MCHHIEFKFLQVQDDRRNNMKCKFTVIKKNQILAVTIMMMLVTAGYLNYKYDPTKPFDVEITGKMEDSLGDAVFVNSDNIIQNVEEIVSNEVETITKSRKDYFIETRIDRTNNYAEQIETYENILLSSTASEVQKENAQNEIKRINDIRNSISIAENLIKQKGFEDIVILVNSSSINAVVLADDLSGSEIVQIQNIIMREFEVEGSSIHITTN